MTIAIDSFYGQQQPFAVSTNDPEAHWGDTVVTQGHADYCAAYGHSTFTATSSGKQSERCGRCGELLDTDTPAVEQDPTERVILKVIDRQGYAPDQVTQTMSLNDLHRAIGQAIEDFGGDALIVTDNGDRYGATFGGIDPHPDIFTAVEAGEDEEVYL